MSAQTLALYLLAAFLVTISPGPDIITVITRSISQGTHAGLVATLGFASGLVFHTAAAVVGLSAILRASPSAFRTVQFLGAAYLLWLAYRMFTAKDAVVIDEKPHERRALARIFGQSVLMNVLNPKVTLFFLAFLSQRVDPQATFPPWLQMVVMGALFAGCTIICFGTCAVIAGRISKFLRHRPHASRPLQWATGLVFVLIAVMLFVA